MARELVAFGLDRLHTIHAGRKSRRGLGCSLLYRANVLVLMPRQGSAASEGLLAVGVRALVRTVTRMGASMTGQRAAIAEGPSTPLAHVRLLSSMHAVVYGQSRSLDELLAALRKVTHMGSVASVDSFVTRQITTPGETLSTRTTRERLVGKWSRMMVGHGLDGLIPGTREGGRSLVLGLIVRCYTRGCHAWKRHGVEVIVGLKHCSRGGI